MLSYGHLSLGSLTKGKLQKDEVEEAEKRVQEVIEWKDLVTEKMSLVEAMFCLKRTK